MPTTARQPSRPIARPTALAAALLWLLATTVQADTLPGLGTWQSTLQARDINGDSIVDAYYDSVQNLTWSANWGLGGAGNWDDANAWANNLDLLGVTGWRLPTTAVPDAGCSNGIGSMPVGYGYGCSGGEMGRLWYTTLGNTAGAASTNTGQFVDMQGSYWSSTPSPVGPSGTSSSNFGFLFGAQTGYQSITHIDLDHRAVAVRTGDVPHLSAPTPLTQSHSATFRGAGGDLTYGPGDNSVVTLVSGVMPLFNTALGALERVTVEFSGWRSLDFTCTQSAVGTPGGCSASVNGRFVLDGVNYPVWSFTNIAEINPRSLAPVGLAPAPGTSLSAQVYGQDSSSVEITDPQTLLRHFTNATGDQPNVDYRIYFQSLDGGAFGQGGAAGITSMQWDGDATVRLTYHYVTAVPEPETWALWLAGLGALGQVARRRSGRG